MNYSYLSNLAGMFVVVAIYNFRVWMVF